MTRLLVNKKKGFLQIAGFYRGLSRHIKRANLEGMSGVAENTTAITRLDLPLRIIQTKGNYTEMNRPKQQKQMNRPKQQKHLGKRISGIQYTKGSVLNSMCADI